MKIKTTLAVALITLAAASFATDTYARGFSGGGGRSFSSSSSRSFSSSSSSSRSFFTPSAPRASSGIGSVGSAGVSKPSVVSRSPSIAPTSTYTPRSTTSTTTSSTRVTVNHNYGGGYGYGGGGGFGSAFSGSFFGSVMGNMLFNHSQPVVYGGGMQAGSAPVAGGYAGGDSYNGAVIESHYGVLNFLLDAILFVLGATILVIIVWLMVKLCRRLFNMYGDNDDEVVVHSTTTETTYTPSPEFVHSQANDMAANFAPLTTNSATYPFAPISKFWEIQDAYAKADVTTLHTLLGPDLVDEFTRDIQPSTVSLKGVSYVVLMDEHDQFSVEYHYYCNSTSEFIRQVWHYEKFDGVWKLNGFETV